MSDNRFAPLVAHLADYEWQHLPDGENQLRWKTLVGGPDAATKAMSFGICELPPGARLPPHHHAEDEVYYVTDGDGEVLLDDKIVKVTSGSVLFVPGNLVHGARNDSETTLTLVWMFAVDRWSDVEYHGADRAF